MTRVRENIRYIDVFVRPRPSGLVSSQAQSARLCVTTLCAWNPFLGPWLCLCTCGQLRNQPTLLPQRMIPKFATTNRILGGGGLPKVEVDETFAAAREVHSSVELSSWGPQQWPRHFPAMAPHSPLPLHPPIPNHLHSSRRLLLSVILRTHSYQLVNISHSLSITGLVASEFSNWKLRQCSGRIGA